MTKKKHYFFSDVHLGMRPSIEEKDRELKLVSFLESIRNNAEKVYIVGDLFDCWIEYRKVVPKGYFRTLAKLSEIAGQGTEIHFFSGNHDFWLNTYLQNEVGLILHYDSFATEISGKRFYITHGDGLSKGDLGYKIIKKILRSRVNQFLFSLIHPDFGIWLAQRSSNTSRHANDEKFFGGTGMQDFAEVKVKEGFDYVVMGHYHKPQVIEIPSGSHKGYYITLGDWIKNFTFGEFSDGEFVIKTFPD